jgi:hypothetical protein
MASPHRSESFFQDGPTSPSILLVPTGDGDSFEVVLGPVFTLVRSDEASPEQESPLAIESADDELVLIEGEPSHVSSPLDRQPLMIIDGAVPSELTDSQAEDLTEQAAADYDYELDEGWLKEQLLDSPDVEVQTSESPVEAPISPSTSHLFYRLLVICFAVYLPLCFVLQPSLVCLRVLPRHVRSLLYLFLL